MSAAAAWAAVGVGALGLAFGLIAGIWRGGRWVERVNAAIELLTKIADDHEKRLRSAERERAAELRNRGRRMS